MDQRCPGCGLVGDCAQRRDALAAYTLGRRDGSFIHQLLVDAYAAQHASDADKPITIAFALVGLFLFAERGYSGRQVQRAHMALARRRQSWPSFTPPANRGAVTVADVLAQPEGEPRDEALRGWAKSVWAAWRAEHARVAALATLLDD